MSLLQLVALSCVLSGDLPLSWGGMSLFGWMVPGNAPQPGRWMDRGRKLQLWRNPLNIHFERALLQTRGATKGREGKRRAAETAPLQWHWLNLWALQSTEDPVFKHLCFPGAKHAPISSGCTKLSFLPLDWKNWAIHLSAIPCHWEGNSRTQDRLGCLRSQL